MASEEFRRWARLRSRAGWSVSVWWTQTELDRIQAQAKVWAAELAELTE